MRGPLGEIAERVAPALRSRRGRALLLCAAAALGAASALVYHHGVALAFRGEDSLEYAVMARRLAQGEGFSTGVVYPAELWLGADAQHPAVKQPPLWPLVLAGPFAVFGAEVRVAYALEVALFGLLVVTAGALAGARGGLVAGCVAALAVATTPANLLLAMEPASETLFTLTVALAFLLCALRAPALWVGVVCGLAYLTRYSGAILLPGLLVLIGVQRREARALAWCAAGFLAVALPWWIRNWLVAGDPFYSLQNLKVWLAPAGPTPGIGLLFEQAPDLDSSIAADPLVKLRTRLPLLLGYLPFASVSLAALAGLVLGCLRRDAVCLALAAIAALALIPGAVTMQYGGYFAPFFPAMIALGAAAWMQYGGILRAPALALLLLAPVLPSLPEELRDLRQLGHTRDFLRYTREGEPAPEVVAALRRCVAGDKVVIAQAAPRVVWQADAVAVYAPYSAAAFWKIVEEQDVDFAQLTATGELAERLGEEFTRRPDCAPDLYERRRDPR